MYVFIGIAGKKSLFQYRALTYFSSDIRNQTLGRDRRKYVDVRDVKNLKEKEKKYKILKYIKQNLEKILNNR